MTAAPPDRSRFVLIALVALLAVVALAVVIAVGGGGDDDKSTDSEALVYGEVEVDGTALDPFPDDARSDPAQDPARGAVAPTLRGQAFDGTATTVEPGERTILAFLAHWCPHCQAELPRLVDVERSGGFDGVRLVAVLTGTNPNAPNYPPDAWLEREGWPGDVLVDDEGSSAATAYGLTGYPFLVALDADGKVVARTSGEVSPDQLGALADATG